MIFEIADLRSHIFEYLTTKDLVLFRSTCHTYRNNVPNYYQILYDKLRTIPCIEPILYYDCIQIKFHDILEIPPHYENEMLTMYDQLVEEGYLNAYNEPELLRLCEELFMIKLYNEIYEIITTGKIHYNKFF